MWFLGEIVAGFGVGIGVAVEVVSSLHGFNSLNPQFSTRFATQSFGRNVVGLGGWGVSG